jgi:hypothetical protein
MGQDFSMTSKATIGFARRWPVESRFERQLTVCVITAYSTTRTVPTPVVFVVCCTGSARFKEGEIEHV